MAETATELLTEFGQALTLTRQSAGGYSYSDSSATVTTSTQSGVGALFDWGSKEIDGTLIVHGDKKLLLSATGITAPKINDTVTLGSTVYTIKAPLVELNPAGTVVMYTCNLRA